MTTGRRSAGVIGQLLLLLSTLSLIYLLTRLPESMWLKIWHGKLGKEEESLESGKMK